MWGDFVFSEPGNLFKFFAFHSADSCHKWNWCPPETGYCFQARYNLKNKEQNSDSTIKMFTILKFLINAYPTHPEAVNILYISHGAVQARLHFLTSSGIRKK